MEGDPSNVVIEMAPTGDKSTCSKGFLELKKLISKPENEFREKSTQIHQIRELLEREGKAIYKMHTNGRNILHVLAEQPDRNVDILAIFDLNSRKNSEDRENLNALLQMPAGAKKKLPIHLAVNSGFFECVQAMLELNHNLVTAVDADNNTPLHIAAASSMPESVGCLQIILTTMQEVQLEEKVFSMKNSNGHTPMHSLCNKVPANENAGVCNKLQLMLSSEFSRDALKTVDSLSRTPLHLLCIKDVQGEDADWKNPNLEPLFQMLIDADKEIINQRTKDKNQHTVLHLLTISEYSYLLKLVVNQGEADLTMADCEGRMAIHYAAENAARPRSQECIEILADWKSFKEIYQSKRSIDSTIDLFREYILWKTFKNSDGSENTVLTLACRSRSAETVEYLLRNVYEAKSNFGIWFAGVESHLPDKKMFSLREVYKNTPEALEFLFDKSIKINLQKSNKQRVEFVTDLSVVTALERPILEHGIVSEMKYLSYSDQWPKETQETLLLHPIAQCAVQALWHKIIAYKMIWLVWNIIWLSAYWNLVPFNYSSEKKKFPASQVTAAWILIVMVLLYFVNELLTLRSSIKRLIAPEFHFKLVLIQMLLTAYNVCGPLLQSLGGKIEEAPSDPQKFCAAAGILLSVMIFLRNIGLIYLPLGVHMEYYIQTLKKILMAFGCIAVVILGFQRAFSQTLPAQFSAPTIWPFTKTLVMMTGEYDFAETYGKYEADDDNSTQAEKDAHADSFYTTTWNLSVFVLFVILIPVTLYNLLIGIVVEKIMNMQSKLAMNNIHNQIRLINYLQETVVAKLMLFDQWFRFLSGFFYSYREVENGQIIFDQEVNWFVEKHVNLSKWNVLCHAFQICRTCNRNGDNHIMCGNLLPTSIKRKIFEIYERDLQEFKNTRETIMIKKTL